MTPGIPGRTIVLVDDTPEIRLLVRTALERRGDFRVVGEAGDGAEGIEVVREQRPDMVLLDIAMPVLDGLDALPRILEACPGTKVVMLSGFGAEVMAERALAAGAVGYVQKGTPVRAMVRKLKALADPGSGADADGVRREAVRTMRPRLSGVQPSW